MLAFLKRSIASFSLGERILFTVSATFIVASFLIFDRENYMTLAASLIGVTSLLYNAKGNPVGQALMVIFSILYGIISYTFDYYGEMITYLGMTMPMAVFALISWLRHPYRGNRSEVAVNRLRAREYGLIFLAAAGVTVAFGYILAYFNTANIIPSTISVTTSFIAVYLTFRRSPCYALGYAANDIVLIILWILAAREDISYLSVVICFSCFLVNDLYGFFSWKKAEKRQRNEAALPPQN